ncbi:acetate/propionate family kinase [Hydrogenimonas sp.]
MKILVLNAGSSSLKYKLFDGEVSIAEGVVEHIGEKGSVAGHAQALEIAESKLIESGAIASFEELGAVGHRVVHGGERFKEPVIIDETVIEAIRSLIPLAPLHNPANLQGIESMRRLLPDTPQVAVFDTAFHQTMPPEAYLYAIPYELYEKRGVRRYGFHGTSHHYVAKEAARRLGRPLTACHLITLHLGNGASVCAIEGGRSVETSMGFTPLAGLVMGTRSGDLDPEIAILLQKEGGDADRVLNRQSGLLGLCGDNDVRRIEARIEAGDERAKLALSIYARRIRHYIGAYLAQLGRLDALVFTAGVGEHSARVRQMACAGLENLGIAIDEAKNRDNAPDIAAASSKVPVFVIPTNEELAIVRITAALLRS